MRTFISFEEARKTVLESGQKTGSESVPLSEASGRVLYGPHNAQDDLPPFASSAMDGFAVRTGDFEKDNPSLRVIDHIAAGRVSDIILTQGTCSEIMTGAVIPAGADAVVPIEWVAERNGDLVSFTAAPKPGRHIRPAAEDLRKGDRVFLGGEVITPPIVGMLASIGVDPVLVSRRPEVAIISTGDEIVYPTTAPGPGQIRNSNGPSLREQVLSSGGACAAYQHAPDDELAIRQLVEECSGADLIIFSGGVSVGAHDHVKSVLEQMGAEMLFWKVKQRPGKPLAFGRLGRSLFMGLPGNPVSSAMCFEVYARPLIRKMTGSTQGGGSRLRARLVRETKKVEGLHFFARGIATQDEGGGLKVEDAGPQQSNLYGTVVRANCIIHLPQETSLAPAGMDVEIELLDWASINPA